MDSWCRGYSRECNCLQCGVNWTTTKAWLKQNWGTITHHIQDTKWILLTIIITKSHFFVYWALRALWLWPWNISPLYVFLMWGLTIKNFLNWNKKCVTKITLNYLARVFHDCHLHFTFYLMSLCYLYSSRTQIGTYLEVYEDCM